MNRTPNLQETRACPEFVKRGTHLGFNAINMQKKISLALLTQVET